VPTRRGKQCTSRVSLRPATREGLSLHHVLAMRSSDRADERAARAVGCRKTDRGLSTLRRSTVFFGAMVLFKVH